MKYLDFSVEDFAADDFFIKWVIESDPEAAKFWNEFNLQNPHKSHTVNNARILLLNLKKSEEFTESPLQVDRMWKNIEERTGTRRIYFTPLRIAASIIVLLAATWLMVDYTNGHTSSDQVSLQSGDYVEEFNTTGGMIRIHLSDGSVVSLENNSRLRYLKDYSNQAERKVYLTGEGLFDIAKNPHKPFFVYANEVVTKVLGTSFRVKAFKDEKNVTISVTHGKVSVFSAKSPKNSHSIKPEINGLILIPNQQAVYKRTDDSFEKTLVEKPQVIDPAIQKTIFLFHNEPIGKVFSTLEKVYGVEIIYDGEVMENCYLTAPLGNESLFEKLKIICKTVGATYDLIDAKIIITSKGCGKLLQKKSPIKTEKE